MAARTPAVKRTQRAPTDDAREHAPLPEWFDELYEPFAPAARDAWAMVRAAEDATLMEAFVAENAERPQNDVEAKRAATVRARLLRAQNDLYRPHVVLLFRLACRLDLERGAALVRRALAAPVADHHEAARTVPELRLIAARHFWTANELREQLLGALLRDGGELRYGTGITHELASTLATKTEITSAEIVSRAEALATGVAGDATLQPDETLHSLLLCASALLHRDRSSYTPVVKNLEGRWSATLAAAHPDWSNLSKQCFEALWRRHAR
ncbi:MAG: hypothetical protein U0269_23350 [Polyangiales bacterium]